MTASARVTGLAELRQTLLSLDGAVASKNGGPLRSAMAKGARKVRDLARSIAPIGDDDGENKKGRLQAAIYASRDKNPAREGLTESYSVGVKRGKTRADTRGAYYWAFVEFGTAKQDKQPFLRPAFERSKDDFIGNFTGDLRKAIAAAVRRNARNA